MTANSGFGLVTGLLLAATSCPPAKASVATYENAVIADGASLYWSFNSQQAATGYVPEMVAGLSADAMLPLKSPGSDYPAGWLAANNYNGVLSNLGSAFVTDSTGLFSTYYVANSSKTSTAASYAVEFWARRNQNGGKYLFAAPNGAAHTAIYDGYNGSGVMTMQGDGGAVVNFAVTDTNWHKYAVVVDAVANTTTTMLDDHAPITVAGKLNPINLDGSLLLGSSGYGAAANGWNGAIDEFAIYDLTGKTSAQVSPLVGRLQQHFTLANHYTQLSKWPKIFDSMSSPELYGNRLSPNQDPLGFQPLHPEINPVNQPGSWYDWNWFRTVNSYDEIVRQNRPLAITLTANTAPLTGAADRSALSKTINYLGTYNYPLNYLFMDFEPVSEPAANADVTEAVRQVRTHANPRINQAKIGAYDYFTCDSVAYLYWANPSTANRDKFNKSYNSAGLNVSMPSLYPYAVYTLHAKASAFGTNVAPNDRAAMFWAPLEKFSTAKRALPGGHELIPWINDFVPGDPGTSYENVTPPTKADNAAMLRHIRLRGADGFHIWKTNSENQAVPYNNEEYRGDMVDAWTSLDWLFSGVLVEDATFLNLVTDKRTGLQWSGAITENGVAVLVSNLGNSPVWFAMPNVPGFNDRLIDGFYIGSGEHRLEMYQMTPEPGMICLLSSGLAAVLLFRLGRGVALGRNKHRNTSAIARR